MSTRSMLARRTPRLTDEQRIDAAAQLGLVLDPVGASDRILTAAVFSLLGLMAVLLMLAWINRSYKPIKAKNLPNITLTFTAAAIGIVGAMPSNGVVSVTGVWKPCILWTVWVKVSMTYAYIFLLIFRAHSLHRVFVQKKPSAGVGHYMPVVLYVVFQLSFNISATLVPPERSVRYLPQLELCAFGEPFHIACTAFAGLFWCIHTIYIYLTRNIKSSFNEFGESLIIYSVGIANLIEVLVLHVSVKNYPLYRGIRAVSTAFDLFCGCAPVIVLLAHPLFMCYFDRHGYYIRWVQTVMDDGLTRQYEVDDDKPCTPALDSMRSADGTPRVMSWEENFYTEIAANRARHADEDDACVISVEQDLYQPRFEPAAAAQHGNAYLSSKTQNCTHAPPKVAIPGTSTACKIPA